MPRDYTAVVQASVEEETRLADLSKRQQQEQQFARRFKSSMSRMLKAPTFNHLCLGRSKFFYNRDQKFLQAISREFQIELFPPGKNIITEGDMRESLYFLHRGEVEILVGPTESRVATLSDGNVFGEMAVFGSHRRAATVRAVEACDCRVIHHRVFTQILSQFPEEQEFFAKMAAERLGETMKARAEDEEAHMVSEPPRLASTHRKLRRGLSRCGTAQFPKESGTSCRNRVDEGELVVERAATEPEPGSREAPIMQEVVAASPSDTETDCWAAAPEMTMISMPSSPRAKLETRFAQAAVVHEEEQKPLKLAPLNRGGSCSRRSSASTGHSRSRRSSCESTHSQWATKTWQEQFQVMLMTPAPGCPALYPDPLKRSGRLPAISKSFQAHFDTTVPFTVSALECAARVLSQESPMHFPT
mmetsp:Transcript_10791/g.23804  ORF Transcript_10791/g.23804 Transcript_10791/m.23804 type:complete len:417 (+) Transcript_10791:1835-3085(+)